MFLYGPFSNDFKLKRSRNHKKQDSKEQILDQIVLDFKQKKAKKCKGPQLKPRIRYELLKQDDSGKLFLISLKPNLPSDLFQIIRKFCGEQSSPQVLTWEQRLLCKLLELQSLDLKIIQKYFSQKLQNSGFDLLMKQRLNLLKESLSPTELSRLADSLFWHKDLIKNHKKIGEGLISKLLLINDKKSILKLVFHCGQSLNPNIFREVHRSLRSCPIGLMILRSGCKVQFEDSEQARRDFDTIVRDNDRFLKRSV